MHRFDASGLLQALSQLCLQSAKYGIGLAGYTQWVDIVVAVRPLCLKLNVWGFTNKLPALLADLVVIGRDSLKVNIRGIHKQPGPDLPGTFREVIKPSDG